MASREPFDFLKTTPPKEGEEEREKPSPFDFLREGSFASLGLPQTPQRETGTENFLEGITRGALYPIKALTGEVEADSPDEGVAGTAGEFVGMGLSFVPFFKVGRAVVGGVGLLRPVIRKGAERMLPTKAGRVLEGALSFGAFEALAGEDVSEAPARALEGVAVGAAFEVAFLGAAGAWRARFGGYKGASGRPSGAPAPDVNIHPDALKIERWLFPDGGEEVGVFRAKLEAAKDPQGQLHTAITDIAKRHMPGGQIILPGMEDVDNIYKIAKEEGLLAGAWHPGGGKIADVLLVDPNRSFLKSGSEKLVREWKQGGAIDIDELLKLVREEIPVHLRDEPFMMSMSGGTAVGRFRWAGPDIEIAAKSDNWKHPLFQLSLLTHEYAHFVTARTGARVARRQGQLGGLASTQGGVEIKSRPEWHEIFDLPDNLIDEFQIGSKGTIWEELWDLTHLTAQRKGREVYGESAAEVVRKIDDNRGYYSEPTEMMSRAVEAFLIDPKEARKLAPRAEKYIKEFVEGARPLQDLMTPEVQAINNVLTEFWVRRGGKLSIFQQGAPQVTKANLRQFSQQGFFPGMEGVVKGESVELLARTKDGILVRNLSSGVTKVLPEEQVMRPLFPNVVRQEKELLGAVGKMLDENPRWVSAWVRSIGGEIAPGVDRATTRLQKIVIDLTDMEIVEDLGRWIRANRKHLDAPEPWARNQTISMEGAALRNTSTEDVATQILDKTGARGLVHNDSGKIKIILGKDVKPQFGDEIRSMAFEGQLPVVGLRNSRIFDISLDDTLRSMLMEKGVPERDIAHFMKVAKRRYGEKLKQIVDPEFVRTMEAAQKAAAEAADAVENMAYRSGMEVTVSDDGLRHLRDLETKAPLGKFGQQEDLADFIGKSGFDDLADDAVEATMPSNIASGNGGGGSPPPKFQSQMPDPNFERGTRSGKLFDVSNVFGASITAMENFASSVEARGLGPALTQIFEPGQKAMIRVLSELSEVKRELLGGRTFGEQFKQIEKMLRPIKSKRRELVTEYIEAMSREEIARPGGLLVRGMNQRELDVAKFFSDHGLGDQIPRLMSIRRLTDSALKSQSNLNNTIRKMKEIKLSEEGQQLLMLFEQMPRFQNADEVYDFLNLDDVQRKALKIIGDNSDADKFSIFAVSKWASARPLGKGYKTGREQFASEHQLTGMELKVADELDKVFAQTFQLSGMDPKRQIGGYWPHMRVWAQHGFEPTQVPGLKNQLPESLEWSALRFRTGELDIYNKDPLVSAYKHARGMLMKQNFDPILPDIKKALDQVKNQDTRAYRIMSEYMAGLMGQPHETFRRAQAVIDGTAKAMGLKVPEQTVSHLVTNLAALAAGAAIPFRPALIARNYFQMIQTVAPRVGMRKFWQAVEFVTNPKTRKEAYEMARKGEAILPNFSPIHASTEIFGSPEAGKLSYRLQLMLEKGFEWYKNADDMGRAVAFHAQRMRMEDDLGKYIHKQLSLDDFAKRAKIETFKEIDASRAKAMLEAGRYEEAKSFLGMKLARESIFRYGLSNHPAGWNSIPGRLFGQFGTWPTQFKDYLAQGFTHGTTKDKAEFAMSNLAINGGILATGATLGVDLMSWVTFPSLTYTGGPFADMAIDAVRSISGSETEKSLARHSLLQQVPVLGFAMTGNPRSMFIPGSYLIGDLMDGANQDNFIDMVLEGSGVKTLSPGEEVPAIQWILDGF